MEDAIFKDNITKFEWKGTSGASAGGDFGPQHPSKSQDSSAASRLQVKSERQAMRTATMMWRSILNNSKMCQKM